MNLTNTNAGGWESSHMRNDICPQFLELLPTDLYNVIGTVTKYTDNVGGGSGDVESNFTATQDKVFLLSYYESGAVSSTTLETHYTKSYDIYTSLNHKIKYQHSIPENICEWWVRSPNPNNSEYYYYVNTIGSLSSYFAHSNYGFSPAVVIY